MKVLIVDDEELIRNVIKEYLYLENYVVKEASNGKEAIAMVAKEDFDHNGNGFRPRALARKSFRI